MSQNATQKTRTEYFDYLRVIATFFVVFAHVTCEVWYTTDIASVDWMILNIFDSSAKWAVAAFVMISGALFLGGNPTIKKIFTKNISRMLTAFLFWSVLYAIVDAIFYGFEPLYFIMQIISGHYHMWFIFMITGVYLAIPFLKKISEDFDLTKYFLILFVVFAVAIPFFIDVLAVFSPSLSITANALVSQMQYTFTLGYVGYFLAGYYYNKIELSKKATTIIYALGILGFVLTVVLTAWLSTVKQQPLDTFYQPFALNLFFMSIAVFLFAKNHMNHIPASEKQKKFVRDLSKYSFGVYLVHVLIIEIMDVVFHVDFMFTTPLISIPLISIFITVLSFVISYGISRIPVLKNYII